METGNDAIPLIKSDVNHHHHHHHHLNNGERDHCEPHDADDDERDEPSRKKLKISSLNSDESSLTASTTTIPNLTNESSAHLLALNRAAEGP